MICPFLTGLSAKKGYHHTDVFYYQNYFLARQQEKR